MLDENCKLSDYEITQNEHDGLIDVRATLRHDTKWAKAGHEVVSQQFVADNQWHRYVVGKLKRPKTKKRPISELETEAKEWFGRLHSHFFRAPTDNDKGFGNWIAKDWRTQELDQARDSIITPLTIERLADGKVRATATTITTTKEGSITTNYDYTIGADGIIDFKATYTPQGTLPPLPCLGTTIVLPNSLTQLTWYGRGPQDNYPDRHASAIIGLWKSTVAAQYFHYPRPQDSGNHDDTAYLELTDRNGKGWRVTSTGTPFSFSSLPYSVQTIYATTHDHLLTEDPDNIYLNIDAAVMGLGNSSCGPGVLTKYAIKNTPHTIHLKIERVD